MNIKNMTALQLAANIKSGNISVKDAVMTYIDTIKENDGEINAFITVSDENLEKRIAKVQEGIDKGIYTSSLSGVPIAIKDNICTKGIKTTCGSKILEGFVPPYDAEVIKRIEAAGMIIVGKTNMDEFAMGSTTESSAYGITRNPWDKECIPGGSSGGSCAAVAAGEVPLALGTDTGGSVRQPAAHCGVVGLKPTYGSVSRYGLIAYASSFDQIGTIGKNVLDCRALYEIIAGYDCKDSTSENVDSLKNICGKDCNNRDAMVENNLKGKRIGIPKEYLFKELSEDVRLAIDNVANMLKDAGAEVEYFSLRYSDYAVPAYYIIACAEASSNLERYDGVKYGYRDMEAKDLHDMYKKTRTKGFGSEVKKRIMLGSFVLSEGFYEAYYLKALKVARLIKEEWDEAFKSYDCILSPVTKDTASKIGESLKDTLSMYQGDIYTVTANICGLPAISIPWGVDKNGLPIGIQLIANRYEENKLMSVAAVCEKIRGEENA